MYLFAAVDSICVVHSHTECVSSIQTTLQIRTPTYIQTEDYGFIFGGMSFMLSFI